MVGGVVLLMAEILRIHPPRIGKRFFNHLGCGPSFSGYMGVSKNSGTPKWMVYYKGKPYEQMDDLGGKNPLFLVQHPTVDG